MRRILTAFVLLLLPSSVWAACTGSSPTWTTTPDYTSIAACVAGASSGDTINVSAGTATWSSTLTITKRIKLIGAGVGQTVITGNLTSADYLWMYQPSDAASSDYFRLSGFTFDADGKSKVWAMGRSGVAYPTWVRLDHCRFVSANTISPSMQVWGTTYGVVDHNTFVGGGHTDNYGDPLQSGHDSWTTLTYTAGEANNLYYEDNTFEVNCTITTGGHGGRYCYRYNTINPTNPLTYTYNPLSKFYPLFDAHGNQSSVFASMGSEVYGNKVNSAWGGYFSDHRGGKQVVFFNKMVGAANEDWLLLVWDDYDDSIDGHPTAPDGTPAHPNHGYVWNNRRGTTGTTLFHESEYEAAEWDTTVIAENVDFFNHNLSFDGTAGIGCGPLASRPATASTVGVGWWATAQDCTAISDDHVGVNPTTPLSGTLYIWDGAAWQAYFTPYTYPHPFAASNPPTAPTNVRIR